MERALNLLLSEIADDGYWARFIGMLREYSRTLYDLVLPKAYQCDVYRLETEDVSRFLLTRLGEDETITLLERIIKRIRKMKEDERFRRDLATASVLSSETEKSSRDDGKPKSDPGILMESPEKALQKGPVDGAEPQTESETAQSTETRGEDPEENLNDRDGEEPDSDGDSGCSSEDWGRDRDLSPTEPPTPTAPSATAESGGEKADNEDSGGGDSQSTDGDDDCRDADMVHAHPAAPHILKCFERQATIVMAAVREGLVYPSEAATIENIQRHIERHVFNPDRSLPQELAEVRHNFYPPFLLPKAICNYHIFAITAPIPQSCKANRSGTEMLQKARERSYYQRLPKWRPLVETDDGLGSEVSPVGELKEEVKLVPLKDDISRLQWAKMRGEHINFFSYPSLHMPPKISRMLMETLLQPFADEVQQPAAEPEMAISDDVLKQIVDPLGKLGSQALSAAMAARRTMVTMAIRYCAELELMERIFREPSSIKKCHEVLHHTFHHGYVRVIREIAKVNLSNYVTFHGVTYNNPLNNCVVTSLLEGADKEDYLLDSIYLFLVLTWQTAMGMWQQAITDETVQAYKEVFTREKRRLYALSNVTDMSRAIVDILMDGDRLTEELRKALPNFTAQSQISAFRHFLMERSNIPLVAAPFLPSDFVPLVYKQCPPLLWTQTYLLQTAFFLLNQGGYLWEPDAEDNPTSLQRAYCPCNLCSPHRMPSHNVALHNEMLAIGTFEIRSAEGKSFKLTPELWTNAYIDKFSPEDFHAFTVTYYKDNASRFKREITACVTQSPEIFSLIRQIQEAREEFLLTKGKGGYKDPQTGENLTEHQPARTRSQPGPLEPQAVSAAGTHITRGTQAQKQSSKALRPGRLQPICENGTKDDQREDQTRGAAARHQQFAVGGGHRRRVPRQSGHYVRNERGLGRGNVPGLRGPDHPSNESAEVREAPKKILRRPKEEDGDGQEGTRDTAETAAT
nr:MAG: 100KDa protein [Otus scops adenovirus]